MLVRTLDALSTVYELKSVQKCLELGAIALLGALLRDRLDAAALTTLLLKAIVPAVVLSSLASLSVSPGLAGFCGAGVLLILCQLCAGHVAARALLGGGARRAVVRRTAAAQVATMAPVLSCFAFIREFVGETRTGYAALVDLPTKFFVLVLFPLVLALRGDAAARAAAAPTASPTLGGRLRALRGACSDPFNAAIVAGLAMAASGTRVADIGFIGGAVRTLAAAQNSVLFLLIGAKFQLGGARPAFVLALLLARHGLVAIGTAAFLRVAHVADPGARLAAVLSSQAATSIIAYGHVAAAERARLGYDAALAFEILGLSFPLSIVLNTAASLIGAAYVDNLGFIGAALCAASAAVYLTNRRRIDAL